MANVPSLPVNHLDNVGQVIQGAFFNDIARYLNALGVVLATDYGCDPSGTVSSVAGINLAIAALPSTGGTVLFSPGTYKIDGAGVSVTKPHVTFAGAGHAFFGGPTVFSVSAGVGVTWDGAAAFGFAGGLKDIAINAVTGSSFGVLLQNTMGFTVEDVSIQGFPTVGLLMRSTATGVSQRNFSRNLSVGIPDIGGAIGLQFTGASGQSTFGNVFYNLTTLSATPTGNAVDHLYLQMIDSSSFIDWFAFASGTLTNTWPVTLDYTADAIFPSDNCFDRITLATALRPGGNGFRNSGTPAGAFPNRVTNILQENGFTANPSIANLLWGFPSIT
jgi:hypothetical protein